MLLPPLRPTFEAALRDVAASGPRFRVDAAMRLGDPPSARTPEALAGLRTLARDESHEVRRAALVSIGLIGEAEDHELARRAIGDAHPAVRSAALAALFALADDDALPDVRVALGSDCETLRAEAVALLATSEAPQDRERLAARLRDDDPDVRAIAALALSRHGDERVVPVLVSLLRTPYGLDAAVSLGRVAIAGHEDEIARVASGLFTSAHVRVACAAALARVGDPRGVRILRESLTRMFSPARGYALDLVAAHGLAELVDVVRTFRARPRGLPADAIAHALSRLEGAPGGST